MRYRSFLLCVALMLAVLLPGALAAEWKPDITCLMDEADVPDSTEIEFDSGYPEGTEVRKHSYLIRKVSSSGLTMGVEFKLVTALQLDDAAWKRAEQFLDDAVNSGIKGVSADTKSMARSIVGTIELSAHDEWKLVACTVTIPYEPGLSQGETSQEVKELQQRLIRYGFLNDTADGSYGANTAAAVKRLKRYIRLLEQDVIDARVAMQASDATLQPLTEANGQADGLLVNYFCSPSFVAIRGTVKAGDSGIEVERVQMRLIKLKYLTGDTDGKYGSSVTQAVRLFQYYNNINVTGTADKSTLELLYSDDAKAAPYSPLQEGDRGDEVKKLQARLRVLGFTNDEPDGIFGASTTSAVKTMQQYMKDKGLKATGSAGGTIEASVTGVADCLTLEAFYSSAFPDVPGTMQNGSSGSDVKRIQYRLKLLKYIESKPDGEYGSGTAKAIKNFQMRHGLSQTGIADESTMRILFSEDAKVALKPYLLRVSIADQRVYIYTYDSNGEYTNLIHEMVCSTGKSGSDTPKGTYISSTGKGARWHYFTKFNCWAQYAYYIEGDIMFHSVLFSQKDGPVTQSSVNNLGRQASHGCVRLAVEDAKWIWENCPNNTTVIVE